MKIVLPQPQISLASLNKETGRWTGNNVYLSPFRGKYIELKYKKSIPGEDLLKKNIN